MSQRLLQREIRIALPGTRADRLAVGGLAALTLILFRPAVFGGQVLFIRDIGMVWYAQIESFVRCIASGSWPLWDVYRGFGQPLLADPSAQVLYPLTWLNLFIRPWHYYTLFAVSHLIVSSFGTYLLARRWGCSRGAAFLAGALWSLSGPLLSLVSLWHHFAGAAWIPWGFLVAEIALSSGKVCHAVGWGILSAVQVLAGSADMVAITGLSVLAYALTHHARWRSPRAEANGRLARSALVATLVALGLSAALWLPALALARGSQRWHLPRAEQTTWSLHPAGLLGLVCLVPWHDLPPLLDDAASLRDLQLPFLSSLYLGGPAAALVAAALISGAPRTGFLACLALGSLLLALGRYTHAYSAATALLPALEMLRFPVKWVILAALSWSLLGGIGYDVWRAPGKHRDLRWILGVVAPLALLSALLVGASVWVGRRQTMVSLASVLLAGAGMMAATALLALARCLWGRPARALALTLAVFVVGELAIRHQDLQHFAPAALFTHRPEVLEALDSSAGSRLYVYDYSVAAYGGQNQGRSGWGYELARAPRGFSRPAAQSLGIQMYLNPPTAGRWGLYGSYDVDLLGLSPEPLARLAKFLRRAEGRPAHLRLLRMGSVRYVVALHRERWWDDLVPVATLPGLFRQPIQVLEVPDPLPRAYLVAGARIADGDAALAVLDDPSFDPAREVILPSGRPQTPTASLGAGSRIIRLDPDRVQVETDARQAGYLVLADAYERGWRVSVDGREAVLLRANVGFRAVAVAAGRHDINFVYRPTEVRQGLLVSAGTAAAVIGFALARRGFRAAGAEAL